LFGTRFVMETDLYGQLSDVVVVRPKPPEIDLIHHTYLNVVTLGHTSVTTRSYIGRSALGLPKSPKTNFLSPYSVSSILAAIKFDIEH
jgi:hypothetical protein